MAKDLSGKSLGVLVFTFICVTCSLGAFGGKDDRVLLKDVSVLTLYKDQRTTGRRSSPVPQLTCVGGSAKGDFTPNVVQCYNRGSDGSDIQWECKTDMDNAYRFGTVEVTCEGYGYPDDPYILKGSCGMEYTLELTEEGQQKSQQKNSYQYTDKQYHGSKSSWNKNGESNIGTVFFLGAVALVIYIVYKTCLSSRDTPDNTHSPYHPESATGDRPPPYSPPPYGFRDEYMPGGCSGSSAYTGNTYADTNTPNQGGGFWSGAATGGLLGYLFGRNNGYGGYTQYQQPYTSPWGSRTYAQPRNTGGWFSGSGWPSGSSYSSGGGWGASSSSGTRTASGFGGTKRR